MITMKVLKILETVKLLWGAIEFLCVWEQIYKEILLAEWWFIIGIWIALFFMILNNQKDEFYEEEG